MSEWTEAHAREALRRSYEIAAEVSADGRYNLARWLTPEIAGGSTIVDYADEHWWRTLLAGDVDDPAIGPGLDATRIDREVRRVRVLAEGRLIRETSERWMVIDKNRVPVMKADRREHAIAGWKDGAPQPGDRLIRVRVTRLRMAP